METRLPLIVAHHLENTHADDVKKFARLRSKTVLACWRGSERLTLGSGGSTGRDDAEGADAHESVL
jgi:hypothetical protein